MDLVVVLLVLAVVVVVVSAPLRSRRRGEQEALESAEHADLTAAKEAKYTEIRDAEMDHRTGKLSEADWRVIDRGLRAEAIELLRRLDDLEGREAGLDGAPGPAA